MIFHCANDDDAFQNEIIRRSQSLDSILQISPFLWRFMSSSKGKNFKILYKKSDGDQITKTASQRIKKQLLVSNNGFLPGFVTFSLYGKLLNICPKIAAENPLGSGAKPR